MSDERLSWMETKPDKWPEAVIAMARMEERMIIVFKRLDMIDDGWKKYDNRMDNMEKQALTRGQKIAFAERIFWTILTGAVGLCSIYLR